VPAINAKLLFSGTGVIDGGRTTGAGRTKKIKLSSLTSSGYKSLIIIC
jgi:hypothetical protein